MEEAFPVARAPGDLEGLALKVKGMERREFGGLGVKGVSNTKRPPTVTASAPPQGAHVSMRD